MTVAEIIEKLNLEVVAEGDLSKEIDGCYCSDLLSHCMSNITSGNLWITVQVNINIIAIAVLTELSAIIISQDMNVDNNVIKKANDENITVLKTSMPSYELCLEVGKYI